MPARESLLSQSFVQLADSLVVEFDIVELLTDVADRCVELLDAGAAGILLADEKGALQVMAASSEGARVLELFQLQNDEGPCLDCCVTGLPVVDSDLAATDRWPTFGPVARAAGYRSVQAFPLRLRNRTIGALNVFMDDRVDLTETDGRVAQALADVATIAILQDQAVRDGDALACQLRGALNGRVAVEQAKGVLAQGAGIGVDEAFSCLRRYARVHQLSLGSVAADLLGGSLPVEALAAFVAPAAALADRTTEE